MNSLSFEETKKLLFKYKIPFCVTELAKSKEEAVSIAEKIGYPVAMKIFSKNVLHKTEIGAVKTNIKNEEELFVSFNSINELAKAKSIEMEGILVQKMVLGQEIIVGMKRNEQFGSVLMFGIGGVLVELLKDVSFRIAPITQKDAIEMIKEIKGYKLLTGFRGKEAVDIDKIVNILISLSNLSLNENNIKEIDFNPVIVSKDSALVVDARILI